MTTDPLERKVEEALRAANIKFTRPEFDPNDPANLDFYLPEIGNGVYIEVKAYHTDRLIKQLALVPQNKSVLVLIGRESVEALLKLAKSVSQ